MKKPSLSIVLFLIFGLSLNAQTPLDKGDAAYGARNFKDAAFHYGRAIMDNPGNTNLQMKLANCYRYLNKMNEAEKRYALVCKNPNTSPINFFNYGTVLQANKKYDKAIEWFGKYAIENKARAEKAQAACRFAKTQRSLQSAFVVTKETGVSHVAYDDYAPVLHKGKLLFTSARKIKIGSGVSSTTDNYVYQATRGATGQLSGLKIVKNAIEIAPQNNLTPFAVTLDEKTAVTTFNQFDNGVRHLYESAFINIGMELTSPKHGMKELAYIPAGDAFPQIGEEHSASFPCFANNGKTIYFAAYNLPGGYGGFDIWVIHQQGQGWSRPQNLGPNVNTSGDEVSPSIANNGHLFFASDHHKGFGGFDIFRSKKIGNVWKDVRNLGNQVNSSFDDLYFVFDAVTRIGYFSSNRDGFYNIYNALMKGSETLMPLVNEQEQTIVVVDPNKTNTTTTTTDKVDKIGGTKPNTSSTLTGTSGSVTQTNTGGYKPTANKTTEPPIDGYNNTTTNTNTNINTNTPTIGNKPTISPTGNGNTIPCAMNFYIGAVIDQETKRPLKGATVYIKNRKTGLENKIKDPTNHYGEYSVILDPLHDYTIAISKSGFKNLVFDVNTGNGGKKTLLGTRSMIASPMLQRDKYGSIINSETALTTNNKPTEDELVNPIKSTGKTFSYESNGIKMPKTGYLIQALVATNLTAAERLELSKYGNIITEARGNKKAFRVGIFADQAHLEKALTAIKATYRDAFKVPVELDNNHLGGRIALSSQVIYPLPEQKPLPVLDETPIQETPLAVEQPPVIKEKELNSWTNETLPEGVTPRGTADLSKPTVAFKVQLGAFKDANNTSFKNISHLGMIEKEKKSNGLTYFYISSFNTLDEARVARTKAKEGGVPAPFIVAFKNGVRVKISDVVN
ncbi:carboxypeptidase-like regulatory domain-containing protein [Aureispira anguillae]|uniref:Carboxypeptidase-like regulatory domain-containing protein n=1 Tax=Aureispira anguillae TaxID=2864201 RepID=A0A915YBE0_9BACT|nr:carboxypeptidase-like regulatory domain-containing protein [Aureispira anguillae]BDS09974.1 carboxypeptidase-like regulatory domain-containing protein [Aureispira anguillae]